MPSSLPRSTPVEQQVDPAAILAADITDPRSRSVKVRHVASMASGHTREMLAEALTRDRDEPVRGFLLIPPDREPGTAFAYSQVSNPDEANPDWRQGYGYQFWMARHGYRGDGARGPVARLPSPPAPRAPRFSPS